MKKLLLIAFSLFTHFAFSQNSRSQNPSFVLDSVNTLTPAQISGLNDAILSTSQKTSVELIVVLLDSLPRGYSIKDFSQMVGNRYQTRTYDANILVYVASIPHHIHHLQAISGPKTAMFTLPICGKILTAMKPDFRAKKYYEGLQLLISNVDSKLDSTNNPNPALSANGDQPTQASHYSWLIATLTLIALAVFAVVRKSKNKSNSGS